MSNYKVTVLGAGLAGCEAALWLAGKGVQVELYEQKPTHFSPAHKSEGFAELICSNSLKAERLDSASGLLKEEMGEILAKVDEPLNVEGKTPFVILMVGVNGVGKTTTIGKLARQFEQQGKSVMLAAGDTFRAAAVEQLQVWGQRNNIPVIAQHTGADSASVIFDAIQAAKARHVDVLIADTAGRLQNKSHLMEELKKIVRVMKKLGLFPPKEKKPAYKPKPYQQMTYPGQRIQVDVKVVPRRCIADPCLLYTSPSPRD